LKVTEEATNSRSTESDPSSEKHSGGKKELSVRRRRPMALLLAEAEDDGDDEERVNVGLNEEEEEEEDQRRMRKTLCTMRKRARRSDFQKGFPITMTIAMTMRRRWMETLRLVKRGN